MKCEQLLAALNDYVDGELDPGICEEFEAHLAECSPCEIVVDNIRRTITLYRHGQPVAMPAELRRRLHQVLRERFRARFPTAEG